MLLVFLADHGILRRLRRMCARRSERRAARVGVFLMSQTTTNADGLRAEAARRPKCKLTGKAPKEFSSKPCCDVCEAYLWGVYDGIKSINSVIREAGGMYGGIEQEDASPAAALRISFIAWCRQLLAKDTA